MGCNPLALLHQPFLSGHSDAFFQFAAMPMGMSLKFYGLI